MVEKVVVQVKNDSEYVDVAIYWQGGLARLEHGRSHDAVLSGEGPEQIAFGQRRPLAVRRAGRQGRDFVRVWQGRTAG